MATYKTGWLRLPTDAKDFKERFAWSHVKAIFYDKAKNILLKDKLDAMDKLISDHADAIANKLMTNDAFNTAIADYVTKSMMSGVQVNDGDHVPTSALAYAMQQAITANANAITRLNSEALFTNALHTVSANDSNGIKNDMYANWNTFKTGVAALLYRNSAEAWIGLINKYDNAKGSVLLINSWGSIKVYRHYGTVLTDIYVAS